MIGPNKYTRAHMGLSAIWKYSSTLLKNAQVRNNNGCLFYQNIVTKQIRSYYIATSINLMTTLSLLQTKNLNRSLKEKGFKSKNSTYKNMKRKLLLYALIRFSDAKIFSGGFFKGFLGSDKTKNLLYAIEPMRQSIFLFSALPIYLNPKQFSTKKFKS